MKKIKSFIVVIVISLTTISCGTIKIETSPDFNFSKNTTLAINDEVKDDNFTKTYKELNDLLSSKGFNVIKYENALKSIELQGNLPVDLKANDVLEIHSVNELKSIYSLEIRYIYYYDIFHYSYRRFTVIIKNLNSNQIVLIAKFKGDKNVKLVRKDFVEKLNLFFIKK